jgi:hypothetical protein
MRRIRYVAIEDENVSGLDLSRAGNNAQQRRLSDSIRPDEPDHTTGRKLDRDRVEGDRFTVTLRDVLDARDRALAPDHRTAFPCNWGGHATSGSSRR